MNYSKLAMVVMFGGLVGCQAADHEPLETSSVEQAAFGSFCNTNDIGNAPFFQPGQQAPWANASSSFVFVQDWTGQQGNWIGGLADLSTGTITWARRATPQTFPSLMAAVAGHGRINVPNPPPPPLPIGTKGISRFVMEYGLFVQNGHVTSGQNANACP